MLGVWSSYDEEDTNYLQRRRYLNCNRRHARLLGYAWKTTIILLAKCSAGGGRVVVHSAVGTNSSYINRHTQTSILLLIYDFIETNLHFPITLRIWHYFLRSGNLNFNTKQEWDHKTKRYKITINYTNCEVWLRLNNLKSKSRIILQHYIFAQKSISIHFTVGVQVGNL